MTENEKFTLEKTRTYETDKINNSSKKTRTYSDKIPVKKTKSYDLPQKPVMNKTLTHNLGVNDEVILNDITYNIVDIISWENKTGEAVIYKIQNKLGDNFALKLYYSFQNPNKEPKTESLRRVKEILDPDILRLYDFGTGTNKYKGKFCFEISAFAKGGDLLAVENIKEKYTPEFLKSNVIPEIFNGIKTLHKNDIIHCDLKPENVFYLDEEQSDLVIGDYGSSKTLDSDIGESLRITDSFNGTPLFISPQLSQYILTKKNDYYSFGIIILCLLYPELVANQEIENETYRKIRQRRVKKKKIIDFNPEFKRINKLIEGLTLDDQDARWGEDQVEKWLNHDFVKVKYDIAYDVKPMKISETVKIKTRQELIDYILTNTNWSEYLINDKDGYDMFLKWIIDIQDLQKKIIFDKMVKFYQQDGEGFLKEAILRYLEPNRSIRIEMKEYDFFNIKDFELTLNAFFDHLDDILKITKIKKLKFYFFQFEFVIRQLMSNSGGEFYEKLTGIIEKIAQIMNLEPVYDFDDYQALFYSNLTKDNLLEMFYYFGAKRSFKNPEDLYKFIESSNDLNMEVIENEISHKYLINFINDLYNSTTAKRFDNMIKLYNRVGEEFIQESILRFIDPRKPIVIENDYFYLHEQDDILKAFKTIIKQLDKIWHYTDLEKLKFYFFQIEFSLRQLHSYSNSDKRKQIDRIINKLTSILKGRKKDDFADFMAVLYPKIQYDSLLDIFYAFDNDRGFKDHNNANYNTIEKMGFFFITNEDLFNDKIITLEKNRFLASLKMESLSTYDYTDLLFHIFKGKIRSRIEFIDLFLDQPEKNDVTVHYKLRKSLSEFLKGAGISKTLTSSSKQTESIVLKNMRKSKADVIFDSFLKKLQSKHIL